MPSLEEYKKRRAIHKATLTRFNTFLTNFNNDKSYSELKNRLNSLGDTFTSFQECQTNIELLDENELNSQERETFENTFYALQAKADDLLELRLASQRVVNAPHSEAGSLIAPTIKLPTLNLPQFAGQPDQWLSFRDIYISLIHENATLTSVQKLHYLRSCLKHEAHQIIASLELTDQSYEIAWKLLVSRYENKKVIINNHIKAIFNIKKLNTESYSSLRNLHDNIEKHVGYLKSLGQEVEKWDSILIYVITSKFDANTHRDWEFRNSDDELPTYEGILSFIRERAQGLEALKIDMPNTSNKSKIYLSTEPKADFNKCSFCESNSHLIFMCKQFLDLTPQARMIEVKKKKLCLNCLRTNHFTGSCRSKYRCNNCHKRHHSLLHLLNTTYTQNEASTNLIKENNVAEALNKQSSVNCNSLNTCNQATMLLGTALVNIVDKFGNMVKCRVLLDSGAQSNFITKEFCNKLQIPLKNINVQVSGIIQKMLNVKEMANIKFNSLINNYTADLQCLVVPTITTNLPAYSFDYNNMNIPDDLQLADPEFNISSEIDMLIGVSVYWELMCQGQIRLGKNLPVLQRTILGWIVSGPLCFKQVNDYKTTCHFINNRELHNQIEQFWNIEQLQQIKYLSPSEQAAEDHFKNTVQQNNEGRFIVSIPFKTDINSLGDSYNNALNRFLAIEKKLHKSDKLRKEYTEFMREYELLGHMKLALNSNKINCYLPHHPVIKEASTTTKLRVVFDASAKTSTGVSLNELQYCGSTMQQDIFSIAIRFRKHNYVMTADIEKMYRQILINKDQHSLQRILWRENINEKIKIFELQTVTYGMTSAPFLAIRTLFELALKSQYESPLAARIIMTDLYVDDLLTGAQTVSELENIKNEISKILGKAGFKLRKWVTNIKENNNNINLAIGKNDTIKTLGLFWNSNSDNFFYTFSLNTNFSRVTKRTILSQIAKLYDPLGFLAPIVILAKLIMQRLWQSNISWDEAVPLDIYTSWQKLQSEFNKINEIRIERHVLCLEPIDIQLHAFCDASEKAYGACVYMRSCDQNGTITCKLLAAKSRVAPIKQISLPKLELCAAVILANLVEKVVNALDLEPNEYYYWCDSTIALNWIYSCPSKWKTFVANRVAEIRHKSNFKNWHHIRSIDNPADLISRGVQPDKLVNNTAWWHGPSWLSKIQHQWPQSKLEYYEHIPERKCVSLHITKINCDFINHYSDIQKLRRITAYIFRFYLNSLSKFRKIIKCTGPLSAEEIENANITIIKLIQNQEFPNEINQLRNNKNINSKSNILPLAPFLDKDGILRVGGRLRNSELSFNNKFPILLPRCHFTKLLIQFEHKRLCHAGPLAVLASLRAKYWLLAGRVQAKAVIRRCIRCFRVNPQPTTTFMGDLPKDRVIIARPFLKIGVDYAGPIQLKSKYGRGYKLQKGYICLFICFVTKAIHLELVSDLTTDCFMAAFRRFCSRRGMPKTVYSDNGTNFVGARNELKELAQFLDKNADNVIERAGMNNISWYFIPPRSPHFGGLWEAGVKCVKHHMKRVLGTSHLNYEDFNTLLTQIEACVNSRPITQLSPDPNDFIPLTPAHLLIGESLLTPPDSNVLEINESRLSRYQRIQQRLQHFWKRWSTEYLGQLQYRAKWYRKGIRFNIGDLVVIKEENLPPLQWKLGRIIQLHMGNDQEIRVVSIKTQGGEIKRAVKKICLLPMDVESEDSRPGGMSEI